MADMNQVLLEDFKKLTKTVAGQPRREEILIAITHENGQVQKMAFGTKIWGPDGQLVFEREPTPANITANVRDIDALHSERFGRVVGWRTIRQDEVPPEEELDVSGSRVFRDALRDTGGALVHDIVHAKTLGLDYVRSLRGAQLKTLDERYTRATGQRDAALLRNDPETVTLCQQVMLEIENQRQTLRDLPQDIDLSKAAVPADLTTAITDAYVAAEDAIDAVAVNADDAAAQVSAKLKQPKPGAGTPVDQIGG